MPRLEVGKPPPGAECATNDDGGEYQQGRPHEPDNPAAQGRSNAAFAVSMSKSPVPAASFQ